MSAIKITHAEVNMLSSLINPLMLGQIPQGINTAWIRGITTRRRRDRQLTKRDQQVFDLLNGIATFLEDADMGQTFTPMQLGKVAGFVENILTMLPPVEEEGRKRVDLFAGTHAKSPLTPEEQEPRAELTLETACKALVAAAHRGSLGGLTEEVKALILGSLAVFKDGSLRDLGRQLLMLEARGVEPMTRDLHSLATKVSIIVKNESYITAGMPTDAEIEKFNAELDAPT